MVQVSQLAMTVWQWASMHNTRTLKVKQLNGKQPSLNVLFTTVFSYCDMSKCLQWKRPMNPLKQARPESTRCLTLPKCHEHMLQVLVIEITALTDPDTHTSHKLMLSVAFPLFDDKQVLIRWVHLRFKFFVSDPPGSIPPVPLLLPFLLLWPLHLSSHSPTETVRSAVSFWWHWRNFLIFPHPLPLLLLLYVLSFASASGKVIRFVQKEFSWWVSRGGHWSLGFPWFDTASAFLLFVLIVFIRFGCWGPKVIVVFKKDVARAGSVAVGALVRCMVRLVVVFVIADFLFLLWRSWSDRGLRTGREEAIFLQVWGKGKQ